jgi:hypothetical protein
VDSFRESRTSSATLHRAPRGFLALSLIYERASLLSLYRRHLTSRNRFDLGALWRLRTAGSLTEVDGSGRGQAGGQRGAGPLPGDNDDNYILAIIVDARARAISHLAAGFMSDQTRREMILKL